jgi:uncharacterized protein YutE (UPF0331/DUF86 family)
MTPPALDPRIVTIRLRLMRDTLTELEKFRGSTTTQLAEEPVRRAAIERFIQATVDLAVDVNGHVAVAELGRSPGSNRESFALVAQSGAIEKEVADRLAPAAGLRNVLVHQYVNIDVARIADAIEPILDGFDEYVRQVASFVKTKVAEQND